MITFPRTVHSVAELMDDNEVAFEELVEQTAIDEKVIDAIVHQRYTPSPEQRDLVCAAFGVTRQQIKWGHRIVPQPYIHAPD